MKIDIRHDGSFDLSTGRSRRETNWKNREWTWTEFLEKISQTHRTAETITEYLASKKGRQDEIKDIGGFVGGYLTNGRRKSESVMHRQLVTLDIDHGDSPVWDDFTMMYGSAAAVYSTHKHVAEAPRLRLIIPLDRPVVSDEYIAIARRIAGLLGIESFDHTTFEPSRLMYWPSSSKDGEFIFDYQDGPWMNADEILGSYRDWRDTSEWPVSQRNHNLIQRAMQKQGDPLEKPGMIGAFCRTYSIAEVIEKYLPDAYEPCDIENRFTYKEGSTAAGLVVYDDKYAYSHHGTDPVSGKLCNAFDLVRLHKFGLRDEDAREGTPSHKLPSYTSMLEFCSKDTRVRRQLGSERLQEAKGDFDIVADDGSSVSLSTEEGSDEWLGELDVDKRGNYLGTINNIVLILENDPVFKGCICYDEFEQRPIFSRSVPWRKITHRSRFMIDRDDDHIEHYLEKVYVIPTTKLEKALSVIYDRHRFHPIRDYLNSVKWDGEERVDDLFIDYMGAEPCEYVRAVTRKTLVAAVARVFQPGVKFDYMLTFIGKQGVYKSTIIGKLGREWYSDSIHTVQGKEAYESVQGVWLAEVAELAGLKKADVEATKLFISKVEDRFRVAYGRRIENFPRQCIFLGSTNKTDFLMDPSGNRRFWPIATHRIAPVKNVVKDLTEYEINQVWAEAVQMYQQGEPLYLSKALEAEAEKVQVEHLETDDRVGLIQNYLDTLLPAGWEDMDTMTRRQWLGGDDLREEGKVLRHRVCIPELWCEALGSLPRDMNRFNTKDLHNLMRMMPGWVEYKSKTRFKIYGTQKGYFRASKSTDTALNAAEKAATN